MINTIEAQYTGARNMSHIKVTFDSPASALAFANKWKLEAPADSDVVVHWHLLPQVLKEETAVEHVLVDQDEHDFIVKVSRPLLKLTLLLKRILAMDSF